MSYPHHSGSRHTASFYLHYEDDIIIYSYRHDDGGVWQHWNNNG